MNMEGFDQNNVWRLRLARYFQKALGCAELSPIYLESVQLQSLFKEYEEGVTSICVIGESCEAGKSGFINALLGESILPTDDIPCTSDIPHRVKFGTNPKAVLYFQLPFLMDCRETLPNDIIDYLKWNNFGKGTYGNDIQIPALEYSLQYSLSFIRYPEIPDNILFSGDSEDLVQYLSQYNNSRSAFSSIELYYPSELLKKRITLAEISVHRFGSDPFTTQKTVELLQKTDVVLYVTDAMMPFREYERKFIEELQQLFLIQVCGIVANRIDLLCNRRDRNELFFKSLVSEHVPDNSVFCVSAKEALDAYKEGNDELLERSGIPKVKAFIEQLAVGKERERFIASSKKLQNVISNSLLPSIKSEISKTFGEHRVEKMGNLIFISTELNSVVVGLNKLIDEIETQTSNETK